MTAPRPMPVVLSLALSLFRALMRTEPMIRIRRRAASIGKKLMLAAYIYIAILLLRVAGRLIFGWDI